MAGEWDRAIDAHRNACSLSGSEASLASLAYTQLESGRYADVVETLGEPALDPDSRPDLLTVRATAKLSLEDGTGAIKDWRRAFEAGFRDDELAATHVRLLLAEGREEEALAFLDKDVFVTEVVRAGLSGVVHAHMNEEDLAGRALSAMEAASFESADTAMIAAYLFLEIRGIGALQAYVEKARAEEVASPPLFTILGAVLLDAGDVDNALAAAEDGLALAPFDETLLDLKQATEMFAQGTQYEQAL